jgi:hypothetical protein
MINTISSTYIADYINAIHRKNRPYEWALCLCVTDKGYVVGIADENIPGYTPTPIVIDIPNYYEASEVLDKANSILFPNRSREDTEVIKMSSMFTKKQTC